MALPRPKERYLRDPPGSHFLCYPPCVSKCLSLFKGVLFNVNSTGVHSALGAKLVQVGRYSLGWHAGGYAVYGCSVLLGIGYGRS